MKSQIKEAKIAFLKPKNLVGRPKKRFELVLVLELETSPSLVIGEGSMETLTSGSNDGNNTSSQGTSKRARRPEGYTNWFTREFWPHIQHALNQSQFKARETKAYLQRRNPSTPTRARLFDKLNESTIDAGFCPMGRHSSQMLDWLLTTLS